jgi:hypothetical protein
MLASLPHAAASFLGLMLACVSVEGVAGVLDDPSLQYAFEADAELRVHGLALPGAGAGPVVLVSAKSQNGGKDSRSLHLIRKSSDRADAVLQTLVSAPDLGPLAAIGAGERGYAVAFSTVAGMQLRFYRDDGKEVAELTSVVPDHVPVAVLPANRSVVLVSNQGLFLVDGDGAIIAREPVAESAFIAAATLVPGEKCGLVSVLVDQSASAWMIQRHCVHDAGLRHLETVRGSGGIEQGHLFAVIADPHSRQEVLLVTSETPGRWSLLTCSLLAQLRCASSVLDDIPPQGIIALGMPLASVDRSRVAAFSVTDDWHGLWLGLYSRTTGRREGSETIPAPLIARQGLSMWQRMLIVPEADSLWIAYAYRALDGDFTAGNAPTQQRAVVAVKKVSMNELLSIRD